MNEISREWFDGGIRFREGSLAAVTAAQKSLMNSSFAKATEDKGGEKE